MSEQQVLNKSRKVWLRIPSRFLVAGVVAAGLLLTGCSPKPTIWHYTKQTTAQLRENYRHTLKGYGVQIIQFGETMRIIVPSDSLFNDNSPNFLPGQRYILKTVVKLMKTYSTVNVKIAGYSDNRHPGLRKQALTTRQAQVVSSYLWSQGIDARLAYAVGYGQRHPVAWDGSAAGRHVNRRIEISFRFYPAYVNYN